ncbi:DUF4236 domain-containing protein [Shigella flexneri]
MDLHHRIIDYRSNKWDLDLKRIRYCAGLAINISKSGRSTSIGGKVPPLTSGKKA